MKTFTLNTIFILSVLANLNSQSCEIPNILLEEYQQDVKHLALSRIELVNSSQLQFAEIPQIWTDTIWEGLAAIFNSDLPQKSEVFDEYCIHHNDGQTLKIYHTLYVNVDTSTSWYSNWQNGEIQTNIPEIDSFFNRYNFELSGTLGSSFKIHTESYFNLSPIVDTIETFDGVNFSEVQPYIGSGNRIIYNYENSEKTYDFFLRWGDCLSGCIYWYKWSFMVDENCNVYFLGNDWNNPNTPDPINCDLSSTTSIDNSFLNSDLVEVRPNPTGNQLQIEIVEPTFLNSEYKVVDLLGNSIKVGELQSETILYLINEPKGIYILILENKFGQRITKKIIKK